MERATRQTDLNSTEEQPCLMALPKLIYEDVWLSRPRRPCYLVSHLNKQNAAESWMRTLRVTAAEGLLIFDNNLGRHDIRSLRYTIST